MGITLAAGDATWDPANGYAKSEYETLRRNADGSAPGAAFELQRADRRPIDRRRGDGGRSQWPIAVLIAESMHAVGAKAVTAGNRPDERLRQLRIKDFRAPSRLLRRKMKSIERVGS